MGKKLLSSKIIVKPVENFEVPLKKYTAQNKRKIRGLRDHPILYSASNNFINNKDMENEKISTNPIKPPTNKQQGR